ncbi:hypothetical protein, partial [Vibrio sp. V26_P1S5P106]|uniref:hypothetical protein n=1 Tax=Vibrio sp. V26_P1S5P106 TaxID=1938678 RepID=UPI001F204456
LIYFDITTRSVTMFSTSLKQWASEIFSGPTSIWRPFKGSKFDAGLFASPHLANCRDYFM